MEIQRLLYLLGLFDMRHGRNHVNKLVRRGKSLTPSEAIRQFWGYIEAHNIAVSRNLRDAIRNCKPIARWGKPIITIVKNLPYGVTEKDGALYCDSPDGTRRAFVWEQGRSLIKFPYQLSEAACENTRVKDSLELQCFICEDFEVHIWGVSFVEEQDYGRETFSDDPLERYPSDN